jgi:hypothetical protein
LDDDPRDPEQGPEEADGKGGSAGASDLDQATQTDQEAKSRSRWTEEEVKLLQWGWGEIPLHKLAERLGRTPVAVWRKAYAEGLGNANRGNTSLQAFARYTGFSPAKIKKSARILKIKFYRGLASEPGKKDRIRDYVIDEDHHEALINFMINTPFVFQNEGPNATRTRRGVWGIGQKPPQCLRCNRIDKPHFSKGYCKSCYNRKYAAGRYQATGNPQSTQYFTTPVLTETMVAEIREKHAQGASLRVLGKAYGVSSPTILRVVTGESWKHAPGPIKGKDY